MTQRPFFEDVRGITTEELLWIAFSGNYIYHRSYVSVLGLGEDGASSESLDRRNRCFNCGSPQHSVSSCPEHLDRPLIALSRAMRNFFKTTDGAEPTRIHEYEEGKAARLRFCDSFDAGSIKGDLLRDALGLKGSEDSNARTEELPWYNRMLQWGYPPGWVANTDPKLKMRSRIEGEEVWPDSTDAATVIDNASSASSPREPGSASCQDAEEPSLTVSVSEDTIASKRWIRYPTTLFSSEHLTIYSGSPLPHLNPPSDPSSTFTADRQSLWDRIVHGQPSSHSTQQEDQYKTEPPWRWPGAFSAFGPVGWQNFDHKSRIGLLSEDVRSCGYSDDASVNNGDRNSDMELSE